MAEIKNVGGASIDIVANDSQARKVFDGFLKFGDGVEKAFKSASDAISTTIKKTEGIAKTTADLSNKTSSMKKNALDSYSQMKSKVSDVNSTINTLKNSTDSYSKNTINGFKKSGEGIKSFNDVISSDTKATFQEMSMDSQTFNQQLVGSMKASTGELKNSFKDLKFAFGVVASSIVDLVKKPVDAVLGLPNKVVGAVKQIASSISSGFSTAKNLAISQVNSIKASILDIPNKARNASNSFKNFFVTGFNSVVMSASSMVSKTATSIASLPVRTKLAATSMRDSLVNGIKAIPSTASAMVSSVTSKVKSLGSSFASVGGNLKNSFSNGFNSVKEKAGSAFQSVKNSIVSGAQEPAEMATLSIGKIVTALGLVKVATKAWNMVTGSIEGAINRVDTLNNSINVFKNMNFDNTTIERVIGKGGSLSTAIDGLPTKLDEAVSNVQMLASSTKDLDRSRDIFKAVNDGVLTFGGSADNVQSIVTQLSKAFSAGKMQGEVFNSMLDGKMGPVLESIAQKMGLTMASLQEGLSKGEISVQQFQDALIDLDQNGGGGLVSLDQSVKDATRGIRTSIANMKTAVGRGVADIITKLNELFEKAGLGGFTGIFKNVGVLFESTLKKIGSLIEENQDIVIEYMQTLKNLFNGLEKDKFMEGFKESFGDLAESGQEFIVRMRPVITFIKDTLVNLITKLGGGNFSKGLGKLPMLLLKVTVGFKALSKVLKILSKFNIKIPFLTGKGKGSGGSFNPLSGVADGIKGFTKNAGNLVLFFGIIKIIEEAAQAIKDVNDKIPSNLALLGVKLGAMAIAISAMVGVTTLLGKLPKKTMATGGVMLAGIVLEIELISESIRNINEKVPSDIADFASKMANIGIAIGSFATLTGIIGKVSSKNPTAAISGLLMIGAFGIELYAFVDVIKKINDKVTANILDFSSKIANISIAISAMGILVGIIGKLSNKNPMSAISGLTVVALIGAELLEFAEVADQINSKVSSNISNFSQKIANIGIAIAAFGALVSIIGIFSSKNPVAAVSGLAVVGLVGVELYAFADVMKKIDTKVPSNIGKFASKMANIAIAIGSFSLLVAAVGALVSTGIGALIGGAGLLTIALIAGDLMIVAEAISQVDKKVPSNFNKVKGKIESIAKVVGYFAEANLGGAITLIKNIYGALNTAVVTGTIMLFIELAKKLNTLNEIEVDPGLAKKKIESIRKALEEVSGSSIGELIGHLVGLGDTKVLASTIDVLISIAMKLTMLSAIPFNSELAKLRIIGIQDVLSSISGSSILSIIGHWLGLGDTSILSETIDALIGIANKLNTLNAIQLDVIGTQFKIIGIQSVLSLFGGSGLIEIIGHFMAKIDTSILSETIDKFIYIASQFVSLAYVPFNTESTRQKIIDIKSILDLIDGAGLKELISHALQLGDMSIMNKLVDEFLLISKSFVELQKEKFNKKKVETTIKNVKEIIDLLSDDNGIFASLKKMITGKIDSETVKESRNTLQVFLEIARVLGQLNGVKFNKKDAETKISNINSAVELIGNSSLVDWIGKMVKSAELLEATKTVRAMISLLGPLNTLGNTPLDDLMVNAKVTQITTIMKSLGGSTLTKYFGQLMKSAELGEANQSVIALIDIVNNLNKLGGITNNVNIQQVTENGSKIATALLNGLKQGLSQLPTIAQQSFTTFNAAVVAFVTPVKASGMSLGSELVNGIKASVSNMGAVGAQIVTTIVSSLSIALPMMFVIGQTLITSLNSGISMMSVTLRTRIIQLTQLISTTFFLFFSNMFLIGKQLLEFLIKGIMSMMPAVRTRTMELGNLIISTMNQYVPRMRTVGANIAKSLADGLSSGSGAVANAMRTISGAMLNSIQKGINGVGSGVTFLLGKLGSDKTIPSWNIPAYANGTSGHPADGPALVNDAHGANYQEAFRLPDGQTGLFPKIRNMLVNLPKGAEVLKGSLVARMNRGMIPRYANGIGNWDEELFNYMDKPRFLIDEAVKKHTDLTGVIEPWLNMTKSAVNLMSEEAVPLIKRELDNYAPKAGGFSPHFGPPFTLSSNYGVRPGLFGDFHTGIDYAAPTGTPIPAQYGGKVERAGDGTGFGLHVGLKVAQNLWTIYGHMSKVLASVGQTVKAGDILGLVGSTGWATGPHVHYELREGGLNGQHVDPNAYGAEAGGPAGAGVERWRSSLSRALKMNSLPTTASYVNAWLKQIQTESGGNEKAIGGNDGLADGNAMGLLQTKPGTFNAYKFPGFGDILNGFHNMLAAINYAKSRYGASDMLKVIGQGHGYENGGLVSKHGLYEVAEKNKPEMIIPLTKPARAFELISQAIQFITGGNLGEFAQAGVSNLNTKTNELSEILKSAAISSLYSLSEVLPSASLATSINKSDTGNDLSGLVAAIYDLIDTINNKELVTNIDGRRASTALQDHNDRNQVLSTKKANRGVR